MNATRIIPGRPIRSGDQVADAVVDLVASTLESTPHIDNAGVRAELSEALPALALLGSGGHLCGDQLVLAAAELRLVIQIPVGEEALAATENSAAPRGAASARDWTLYLPAPAGLAALVDAAAAACAHLSTAAAPTAPAHAEATAAGSGIDLTRLLDRNTR